MESKTQCALCTRRRSVFYCPRCTSDMLQQRRTMLAALQADVAVLRKKTEFALNVRRMLCPLLSLELLCVCLSLTLYTCVPGADPWSLLSCVWEG